MLLETGILEGLGQECPVDDEEGLSRLLLEESELCEALTSLARFTEELLFFKGSSSVEVVFCFAVEADACCLHLARLFLNHTCNINYLKPKYHALKIDFHLNS